MAKQKIHNVLYQSSAQVCIVYDCMWTHILFPFPLPHGDILRYCRAGYISKLNPRAKVLYVPFWLLHGEYAYANYFYARGWPCHIHQNLTTCNKKSPGCRKCHPFGLLTDAHQFGNIESVKVCHWWTLQTRSARQWQTDGHFCICRGKVHQFWPNCCWVLVKNILMSPIKEYRYSKILWYSILCPNWWIFSATFENAHWTLVF